MALTFFPSPLAQTVIISFISLLCPGMYNALSTIGSSGSINSSISNIANIAIYVTLTASGIIGGSVINLLGIRWTVFGSCLTYATYSASYLVLDHTGSSIFTIVSSVLLGVGAGILWSAQGMVTMSYPRHDEKGRYISVFWGIFNLGGFIGGSVLFAINYNLDKVNLTAPVPEVGYIVFVMLETIGALCALFLVPPMEVVRGDGTYAMLEQDIGARTEASEVFQLFRDKWALLLFPMCFSSNFFYTYQWEGFNGPLFNVRTRGFNTMVYWVSQIAAVYVISFLYDCKLFSRRKRGVLSAVLFAVLANAMWGCTFIFQLRYTHGQLAEKPTDYPGGPIDLTQIPRAIGPIALFSAMGVVDALQQSFAYWLLGVITDDALMLSRYAGFYKSMQSLGAAIAWQLGALSIPLMDQLVINWGLLNFTIPFTMYFAFNIGPDFEEELRKKRKTAASVPMNFIDLS
ncbi:hypothetical protein H4R24_000321 [Coemansia sp. RSA 988]|nr:hypothetical protein H4R24_000321 [Coemansia sp. RSA 988]